ncbi:cytochrome P450 [Alicyclobacillus fastidiosus]|uniref:Cytochrome P450 n=1 Tax=Alicyclobacillus fastidiosus TaxID=392011 RepID=A0ABY6ZEW2_9BACL|nr:cytochrome P450 [Alicyclobacillus fastidiosus]WAH41434.1 cytochrome P450 [Alicyclobacillus fastidiosus]GMA63060.1 putative cytochrome P450 YjiB [Alicyclobacillus fastidiosus]
MSLVSAMKDHEPFPWYQSMREHAPVHYNSEEDYWEVFRFEDVNKVLSDHKNFSSDLKYLNLPNEDNVILPFFKQSLIQMDPPQHKTFRNLVNQPFWPKSVAELTPRIQKITYELLNGVAGKEQMDVIDDFAYPLPVTVIAELLGVPHEDRDLFKHWADVQVATGVGVIGQRIDDPETLRARQQVQDEMSRYFKTILEARRKEPQSDLITHLLASEIQGERLSEEQLLGFCSLLLIAGHITTTNLIANAFLCLAEYPEALTSLRNRPELIPSFVEEVLRYRSPVQRITRFTATDTKIGGQTIRAGQRVLAWIGSANRDELNFPNANQFDLERNPNPHLAFGHGIHICLGAPLARLEGKVAFDVLLQRLSDMNCLDDTVFEPIESSVIYGVKQLPIRIQSTAVV